MQDNKNVMSMEVDFDFATGGQQIKVSILVSLYFIFSPVYHFRRFFLTISR